MAVFCEVFDAKNYYSYKMFIVENKAIGVICDIDINTLLLINILYSHYI